MVKQAEQEICYEGGNAYSWKKEPKVWWRRDEAGVVAADGTRKGRPPKLDKKVEEDLIAENQRLRMEIEYIKNWVP